MEESKSFDNSKLIDREEMLRAFISPNNQASTISSHLKDKIASRNPGGLKASLSEGVTDLNKIQTSKNPSAFQSFSTERLAAKIHTVKKDASPNPIRTIKANSVKQKDGSEKSTTKINELK